MAGSLLLSNHARGWRSGFAKWFATKIRAGAIPAALVAMIPTAAWAIDFEIELVDTTGISGISLALDAGGEPHLVYADGVREAARYARKSGGTWTYDVLNFAFFNEGDYPSLEIDPTGNPHAIYQATNLQFPIYAHKSDGAWQFESPGGGEQSGMFNSLELDSQNFPHFTDYIGSLTYIIRYHRRTAAGWTTDYVDAIDDIGVSATSLALDGNDVPHVTYNGPGLSLRYAFRVDGVWTRETIEPSGCNVWAPIVIDPQGTPCVAYSTSAGIRYARRVGGVWTTEAVTPVAPSGFGALSMALDSQGEPHLLYGNGFVGDLYYAYRSGGTWTEELIVDWANYVGYANSLALDASDNPHIAFVDATAAAIYYGHVPTVTGAADPSHGTDELGRGRFRIQISPNPSSGEDVEIRLDGGADVLDRRLLGLADGARTTEVSIFDASGRIVNRLGAAAPGGFIGPFAWELRADDGRALAPGVYFVRAASGGAALATERFTILR